jgi:hypothetical protein
MIKKIFITLFLFSLTAAAQDDRPNPNVELPDFVITGTDVVSVQISDKLAPEFVSTISEEFIKPRFTPEELGLREPSHPMKNEIKLFDNADYLNGYLSAGVGLYTLPSVKFRYTYTADNLILEGIGLGMNRRAYEYEDAFKNKIENTDRYSITGVANLSYIISNDADFLPYTNFKLHGDYGLSSYKLFAFPDTTFKRNLNKGNFSFSMNNLSNKLLIYDFSVGDNYTFLSDEKFSENTLRANGMAKVLLKNVTFGAKIYYLRQWLESHIDFPVAVEQHGARDFLNMQTTVGLEVTKLVRASFGFNYAATKSQNYFSPYLAVALKVDKNLSFFGEYAPAAEFLTAGDFLRENEYLNYRSVINHYFKKSTIMNFAVKYEYDKYFQIDGGLGYFYASNYPYHDTISSGKFDLKTADEVKSFTPYLNLLFHPGPFGMFYGTIKLNDTRTADTLNQIIPYHPALRAALAYSYNFNFGVQAGVKLDYASKSYVDINNEKEIEPFIDFSLNFSYKFMPNFSLTLQLNNLLNNKNYLWDGYRETPVDIIAGLNYRW